MIKVRLFKVPKEHRKAFPLWKFWKYDGGIPMKEIDGKWKKDGDFKSENILFFNIPKNYIVPVK